MTIRWILFIFLQPEINSHHKEDAESTRNCKIQRFKTYIWKTCKKTYMSGEQCPTVSCTESNTIDTNFCLTIWTNQIEREEYRNKAEIDFCKFTNGYIIINKTKHTYHR